MLVSGNRSIAKQPNVSINYMKITIVSILTLFLQLTFVSCSANRTKDFNDPTILWETDSFYVEVENKIFLENMNRWKKEWDQTAVQLEGNIKSETRNIFSLATDYSTKFMLETWTGKFYNRKEIIIRRKLDNEVEENIIERQYSTVGTDGIEIYIRENVLFRIIKTVY